MYKFLFILSTAFIAAFSCTMDCKSCHPKFDIEQEQHKELKACYSCHKDEDLLNVDMGAACGADCFSCHPVQKLNSLGVKEHEIMAKCQECHKADSFQSESNKFIDLDSTHNLKDFLK